jgi:hypothetical protein
MDYEEMLQRAQTCMFSGKTKKDAEPAEYNVLGPIILAGARGPVEVYEKQLVKAVLENVDDDDDNDYVMQITGTLFTALIDFVALSPMFDGTAKARTIDACYSILIQLLKSGGTLDVLDALPPCDRAYTSWHIFADLPYRQKELAMVTLDLALQRAGLRAPRNEDCDEEETYAFDTLGDKIWFEEEPLPNPKDSFKELVRLTRRYERIREDADGKELGLLYNTTEDLVEKTVLSLSLGDFEPEWDGYDEDPMLCVTLEFFIRYIAQSPAYTGVRRLDACKAAVRALFLNGGFYRKKFELLDTDDPAAEVWEDFSAMGISDQMDMLSQAYEIFEAVE